MQAQHSTALTGASSERAEPQPADADRLHEIVIEPGRGARHYWRDLWQFRELFFILAWRDVSVRYRQTVAGVGWAVLQPFVTMVVMTAVFGGLAGLPSEGDAPYAVMVFAGMLPWQFFANMLSTSSQSVVSNAALVSKVYFPRIIIPCSAVVVSVVDLAVSLVILAALMAWYRFVPDLRLLMLPLLVVLAALAALGPGLIAAALSVRYRDFRFVIPFVVQVGLYVSPVAYSSAVVREKVGDSLFFLYTLNPMVSAVDGFRWAILRGSTTIWWPGFFGSAAVTVVLAALGFLYFRRTERVFADVI